MLLAPEAAARMPPDGSIAAEPVDLFLEVTVPADGGLVEYLLESLHRLVELLVSAKERTEVLSARQSTAESSEPGDLPRIEGGRELTPEGVHAGGACTLELVALLMQLL